MENNRTNWVSLRVGVFCGDIGVDVSQLPPFHLTHDYSCSRHPPTSETAHFCPLKLLWH